MFIREVFFSKKNAPKGTLKSYGFSLQQSKTQPLPTPVAGYVFLQDKILAKMAFLHLGWPW